MSRALFCLVLLFLASPGFGQESTGLEGKRELSLHGDLDFQGPNGDTIDLRVGYAWFLRDNLLWGLSYEWVLSEDIAPGNGDYRAQQAAVELQYLFPGDSPFLPYVGVEAGLRKSEFANVGKSGAVLGVSAGTRYLLNESVAIDLSLRYLTSSEKLFIVDFVAEKQYIVPTIGLKALF